MNTAALLSLDAFIFFVGLVIALIYIFKNTLKYERKWYILYVIISFSSMNIFIKPVQDYLIVTPRTFIFYEKILHYFSPNDFIFIFLFILTLLDIYQKRHFDKFNLFGGDFFSLILKRDLLLFGLSFIGFIIFWIDNGEVDMKVQIRSLRYLLFGLPLYYFCNEMLKINCSKTDVRRTIETLYVLNFINMLNQAVSAYFLQDITWERNGWKACFLDQIDVRMYFMTIPMLLSPLVFISRKIIYLNFFVFILLMGIYIKSFYLVFGLSIIIIALISFIQGRIAKKIFVLFNGALLGVVLFIGYISKEESIMTRQGQLDMLFEMYDKHKACTIFGIGYGGMIKHQELTEDGGEIRAIDVEQMKSNYTTTFQVPFFSIFKISGFVGIAVTLIFMYLIFQKCVSYNKKKLFFSSMSIIFFINFVMNFVFIAGDPQGCLYACASAFIFVLTEKYNILN